MPHTFSKREMSDAELILMVQKNDEKAFTLIYYRHHEILYLLAYRYLKDQDQAKDAVQTIFLKFWEKRASLSINVNVRNYLYTMLKNHLLNELRNDRSRREKVVKLKEDEKEIVDEAIEEDEERSLQLHHAIGLLPKQKQTICRFKLSGELSNNDIAKEMNVSVSTVKTHYAQAIKQLRVNLRKKGSTVIMFFMI